MKLFEVILERDGIEFKFGFNTAEKIFHFDIEYNSQLWIKKCERWKLNHKFHSFQELEYEKKKNFNVKYDAFVGFFQPGNIWGRGTSFERNLKNPKVV